MVCAEYSSTGRVERNPSKRQLLTLAAQIYRGKHRHLAVHDALEASNQQAYDDGLERDTGYE